MIRKLTSIGLVLYILVLMMQPCQDVFAAASDNTSTQTQTQSEECETETCSPFCICSCCSLSVAHQTFTTSLTIERSVDQPADVAIGYRSPYDLYIRNSIWQPPKA